MLSTKQNKFAANGIERIIPLRFIALQAPGTTLVDVHTIEHMRQSVDMANEIFRVAGIQFFVRTVETYNTSTFAAIDTVASLNWSSVSNDLLSMFPAASVNGPDYEFGLLDRDRTEEHWLGMMSTVYGRKDEIPIYLVATAPGCGGTEGPHSGKMMQFTASCLAYSGKLAHELGHYFGNPHPFQLPPAPGTAGIIDPQTGVTLRRSNWWDLVYKPGTSNTFFSDQTSAQAQESSLAGIDTNGNCSFPNPANPVQCVVNGTTYNGGSSSALKGLDFTSNDTYTGVYSFQYGTNIMSYMADGTARPNSFSNSQVLMMRKYLRYQVYIYDTRYTGFPVASDRALLGYTPHRVAAHKLDFDGDNKRDIVVWVPPIWDGGLGTYKIWLSSKLYASNQVVTRTGGKINDIPVPGNYNGDGRTDMAFYRASTLSAGCSQASWNWCPTSLAPLEVSATPICSEPWSQINLGCQTDIPLPDLDFDGNPSTPEVTVFRPAGIDSSSGAFHRKIIGGTTTTSWYLGDSQAQPLPGDYDGDSKTDLAIYEPSNARFYALFSLDNWAQASKVTRSFSNLGYAPNPNGTAGADRAGAVVVTGMYDLSGSTKTMALSLWDPHTGVWAVNWNPRSSSAIYTCQWGDPGDVPLGGLGPISTSASSDFAVFRHGNYSGLGYLHRRQSLLGGTGCGTSTASYNLDQRGARTQAFSVQDVDGDGKNDLFVLDALRMKLDIYTSASSFSQPVYSLLLGEQGLFL